MVQNYIEKTNCRVCGNSEIDLVLDLPKTPVGDAYLDSINDYHDELNYPIDMHYCNYCGLGQLIHVVDPKILYNDFTYETSVSLGLIDHFNIYAKDVIEIISLNDDDYIFDIGSNDGSLLKTFKSMGYNVLGIDPAIEIANKATHNGIETIPKLFSYKLSNELKEVKGCPKVITSNNTMANIDDLDEFAISVKNFLHKDGLFIFETLCLEDILDNMFFDHIYHEHISYFSINSLRIYFNKHDMELLDIVKIPSKGGSYRGFVQHKDGARLIDSNLDIMIKNESNQKVMRKKFNLLNNTLRNTKKRP